MSPKYARATAVAVQDGKCLLVQERRARRFSLPGGRIRPGESSNLTVARELYEETGLRAQDPTFVGYHEGHYATHHIYLLEVKGEVRLNRRELSNFLWWNGSDVLLIQRHVSEIIQLCRDFLGRSGASTLPNLPGAEGMETVRKSGEEERGPSGEQSATQGIDFELAELVGRGESDTVEFKPKFMRNAFFEHAALKSIAAFLNSPKGGTLIVGVSDDGRPLGINDDDFPSEDRMSQHLVHIVNSRMRPNPWAKMHIAFEDYEGHRVMVVRCEASSSPVYLTKEQDEEFYVRAGPTTIPLSVSQTQDYIKQRWPSSAP